MIVIPLKCGEAEMDIFVVLEDDNIQRIQQYDPAEIVHHQMGQPWADLAIRNVVVSYASPTDMLTIKVMLEHDRDVAAALRYLSRGFAFRPDKGDTDQPYVQKKAKSRPNPGVVEKKKDG